MYWTKAVKTLCSLVLVLGIAASIIGGLNLISTEDDSLITIGIIVLVVGTLVSVASVAFFFMMCEISTNIYQLCCRFGCNVGNPNTFNPQFAKGTVPPPMQNQGAAWGNKMGNPNMINPQFARGNVPPPAQSQGNTWVCPECDKVNPSECQICTSCGHER